MQITTFFSIVFVFSLALLFSQVAYADVWDTKEDITEETGVWIPDHEFVGFFDANGVYTVVGNVKNSENYPIIPTITITIQDDFQTISESIQYVNIMPGKELPFKFVYPEVQSSSPTLLEPQISYIRGVYSPVPVEVIYDKTLVLHPDGSQTGRIINTGSETIPFVSLLAVVHGFDDKTLDMGKNHEPILDLKPGEIREFVMYPDPSISSGVWYYSCFAVVDDSIIILNTQRNDQTYTIRYDSGILISYPQFNEQQTELTLRVNKGWPLENYFMNIELPRYSNDEEFTVYLDDQKIESIQSLDDMGNWHVIFDLKENVGGVITIKGFDPHATPTIGVLIPDWVRNTAGWWSQEKIDDEEFASGIEFMIQAGIIQIPTSKIQEDTQVEIPDWVRNSAGWWSNKMISDEDFASGLQFMIERGIISV